MEGLLNKKKKKRKKKNKRKKEEEKTKGTGKMPIAGSDTRARVYAHGRHAGRYAKENRMDKALAHFGRALEYGAVTSGASKEDNYLIYVRIYVTESDIKGVTSEKPSFLWIIDDRGPNGKEKAREFISKKESEYGLLLQTYGYTSSIPTLNLEFYNATEKSKRGVYIDLCKSDGSALAENTQSYERIVTGIRDIVARILDSVYPASMPSAPREHVRLILGIDGRNAYEYAIKVNLMLTGSGNIKWAEHNYPVWRYNITGKMRRRLVDDAGFYVDVKPIAIHNVSDILFGNRSKVAGSSDMKRLKRIVVELSRKNGKRVDHEECYNVSKRPGVERVILDELRLVYGDRLVGSEVVFISDADGWHMRAIMRGDMSVSSQGLENNSSCVCF